MCLKLVQTYWGRKHRFNGSFKTAQNRSSMGGPHLVHSESEILLLSGRMCAIQKAALLRAHCLHLGTGNLMAYNLAAWMTCPDCKSC